MTNDVTQVGSPVVFYGGTDPLDAPRYTFSAAARYVGVPPSTVRWWVKGRTVGGHEPVIGVGDASRLSFLDLVEIHVLKTLRRVHGVSLPKIREAVRYAEATLQVDRILLREDLRAFAGSVMIDHLGTLVDLSRGGQIAMKRLIEAFLTRIERDPDSRPATLFPVFQGITEERPVSIRARVAFGRPTVSGTSLHTAVVASRVDAGESIYDLADDYGIEPVQLEWALVYESMR